MTNLFDKSKEENQPKEKPSALNTSTPHRPVEEYSEVMKAQQPTKNPLDSFVAKPEQTFFDSQADNEHVILLLRKHPFTQVGWVLVAIVLILFPFIFTMFPAFDVIAPRFEFATVVVWYLITTGFILESFLSWFFNVYIVTDERVIDVDFYSLLYRSMSAAKIDNIEDVTSNIGGAAAAIFDYGTVVIQTAGAKQRIEFDSVPFPAKVTKLLNELLLEEEREKIEGRVN